jgi:hypothetical protein
LRLEIFPEEYPNNHFQKNYLYKPINKLVKLNPFPIKISPEKYLNNLQNNKLQRSPQLPTGKNPFPEFQFRVSEQLNIIPQRIIRQLNSHSFLATEYNL